MGHSQQYVKGKLVVLRHFEFEREKNAKHVDFEVPIF